MEYHHCRQGLAILLAYDVLDKMVHLHYTQRYQSVSEVLDVIEEELSNS
ncbi:MAG: hypothetical protein ACREPR_19630 [Brasilonema sp.]